MHSSMPMTRNFMVPLAAILALVGCGGDDGPSEPSDGGGDATVQVQNNVFNPSTVTVPINGTVTWQWNSGGVAHNVTFSDVASDDQTSGSFERTFSTTGSYNYVCTLHEAQGMVGTVNVTAGSVGDGGDGGGGGEYP